VTKAHEAIEPLLTIKEVAKILATSEKTVRRRIENRDLPIIRDAGVIRIRPDDLRSYIARRRDG
jgi:excisionase family DNA binding protein